VKPLVKELRCSKCARFFANVSILAEESDFILKVKCQRSHCKALNIFPFSPKIDTTKKLEDARIYNNETKALIPYSLQCRMCGRFMAQVYVKNTKSDFSLEVKCQGSGCKSLNMLSFGPKEEVAPVKLEIPKVKISAG